MICLYSDNKQNESDRIICTESMHMHEKLNSSADSKPKIFYDVFKEPRWVHPAKRLNFKISLASLTLRS
jgi:hypothetical protein